MIVTFSLSNPFDYLGWQNGSGELLMDDLAEGYRQRVEELEDPAIGEFVAPLLG